MPPKRFDGLGGGGLHGGQIADVGDRGEHVVFAEFGGNRRQFGLVEIGEHQPGALVAQAAGDLGADSPPTAGDEDNFAVK